MLRKLLAIMMSPPNPAGHAVKDFLGITFARLPTRFRPNSIGEQYWVRSLFLRLLRFLRPFLLRISDANEESRSHMALVSGK